jgi:hypothetical protein
MCDTMTLLKCHGTLTGRRGELRRQPPRADGRSTAAMDCEVMAGTSSPEVNPVGVDVRRQKRRPGGPFGPDEADEPGDGQRGSDADRWAQPALRGASMSAKTSPPISMVAAPMPVMSRRRLRRATAGIERRVQMAAGIPMTTLAVDYRGGARPGRGTDQPRA